MYILAILCAPFLGVLIGFIATLKVENANVTGLCMSCGAFFVTAAAVVGIPYFYG